MHGRAPCRRWWPTRAAIAALIAAGVAAPGSATAADDVGLVTVDTPGSPAVLAVAADGTTRTVIAGGALTAPAGLASLGPGAALVTDRGAGSVPGMLWRLDESASATTLRPVAKPGALDQPLAVAVSPDGSYLVTDDRDRGPVSGAILRVDPVTGDVTPIASGAPLQEPNGIAIEPAGTLLVSDVAGALYRVRPDTGEISLVTAAPAIDGVKGMALLPAGALLALPSPGEPRLALVDHDDGSVAVVAEGPPLEKPVAVAARADGGALILDRGPGAALALAPSWSTPTVLATSPALAGGTAVTAWEVAPTPPPAPPPPAPVPPTPQTPPPPGPPSAVVAAGEAAPVISLGPVAITPSAFRAEARGPAVVAQARGAKLTFELSSSTRVRLTFHACRSRGARLRCKRTRRLPGKVFVAGRDGANRLRLSGRLGDRPLPPGDYRLFAKARQADGSYGPSRQQVFTILP